MSINFYGIGGLIVLILDIWAIISIINSSSEMLSKVLWTLIVLVFPILGFIVWFFFGPKSG